MPYKPTGRPPGRPKTKEYVTLMARVDIALADQVKRYAALHRQPLSVVIRDALSLLMEEYPSSVDLPSSHRLTAHEFLSDRYESPLDTLVGEADSTEFDALVSGAQEAMVGAILSDTNTTPVIMSDAKPVSTRDMPACVSDTNTQPEILSDRNTVPEILSDSNTTAELPPYDPAKYVLGKLCPGRHAYGTTGQSLLRLPKRQCDRCKTAANRRYRQARQA